MTDTLDSVAVAQLVWKPGVMRDVARRIVEKAQASPDGFWPDEIPNDVGEGDRHCIGSAWRLLMKFGVIQQTGQYRRSLSPHRNRGAVFEYRLADANKAELFISRNPKTVETHEQTELLATTPAHQYPR